jgi:chemotaxis protein methyltransferase CheR
VAEKREREFAFGRRDFEAVRDLVGRKTGIALSDVKSDMVYSRLARRLRANGMTDFPSYLAMLEDPESAELEHFLNALTTNLTAFFREAHHFDHLAEQALPTLLEQAGRNRIRIWSAGCSTGEEPYTLAMVAREVLPASADVRVLATDVDTEVLARAESGIYAADRVKGLSRERLQRHFLRGTGRNEGRVRLKPEVRELVDFQYLNMIETPWRLEETFDIVFCRNVIIYFDRETQRRLFQELPRHMAPGGWLYIGHSETLWQVTEQFDALGQTVYRLRA